MSKQATEVTNSVLYFPDVELRASKNDKGENVLTGLAIPYEKRSQLLYGLFYEIIRDGAFKDSLADNAQDVRYLYNHNPDYIIARRSNNRLTLTESKRGVEFSAIVPDTSYCLDLLKNVDNGNVRGMSFGFRALTYDWGMMDGEELRDVSKAKLIEISAVGDPAYLDTEVYRRSAEQCYEELKRAKQERHDKEMADLDVRRRKLTILEKI